MNEPTNTYCFVILEVILEMKQFVTHDDWTLQGYLELVKTFTKYEFFSRRSRISCATTRTRDILTDNTQFLSMLVH